MEEKPLGGRLNTPPPPPGNRRVKYTPMNTNKVLFFLWSYFYFGRLIIILSLKRLSSGTISGPYIGHLHLNTGLIAQELKQD